MRKTVRAQHGSWLGTRPERFDRLIDPDDRIQLAGDNFNAPAQNNSVVSGEIAAQRLRNALALTTSESVVTLKAQSS